MSELVFPFVCLFVCYFVRVFPGVCTKPFIVCSSDGMVKWNKAVTLEGNNNLKQRVEQKTWERMKWQIGEQSVCVWCVCVCVWCVVCVCMCVYLSAVATQNVLIFRYILKPNNPHYIDAVSINNSSPATSRFSFFHRFSQFIWLLDSLPQASTGCARFVLFLARNRNKFPTVLTKQHITAPQQCLTP